LKSTDERKGWLEFIQACLPEAAGTPKAAPLKFELLAGDGSTRRFYRVSGASFRAVLMVNPGPPSNAAGTVDENDSFVYVAGLLRKIGAGAPEVYGFRREAGLVLMEDVGGRSLQERVQAEGTGSAWTVNAYRRLLELLTVLQLEGGALFEPSLVFNPGYDAGFMYRAEGLYFLEYFLERHRGIKARGLRHELRLLAERAAESTGRQVLLYRDFQSRNIILGPHEEFRLLDFQGARLGPPAYDVASLVYDPYVALPDGLRSELLDYYRERLAERAPGEARGLGRQFPLIAAHRLMQVLGAYAKLWLVDRKQYFLDYVPAALADLRRLVLGGPFEDFPVLRNTLEGLEPSL